MTKIISSCSHGQSNYRAWSHPNISLSFNYFLKQITNIFVTEAPTDTNIYTWKVREGCFWDWNEAVTKPEFIVTIWAKVRLYSLHPLLPSLPPNGVIKPYKRQNLSSHIFQFYCTNSHLLYSHITSLADGLFGKLQLYLLFWLGWSFGFIRRFEKIVQILMDDDSLNFNPSLVTD